MPFVACYAARYSGFRLRKDWLSSYYKLSAQLRYKAVGGMRWPDKKFGISELLEL